MVAARPAVLNVSVSVCDVPGASEPDVGMTLTQTGRLLLDQFKVAVPVFVSVSICGLGLVPCGVVRLTEPGVTWKCPATIWTVIERLKGELSAFGLVIASVVIKVDAGRLATLKVSVKVCDAPGASAPEVGLRLTQEGRLPAVQFSVPVPVFFSVSVCGPGFTPRGVVRFTAPGVI